MENLHKLKAQVRGEVEACCHGSLLGLTRSPRESRHGHTDLVQAATARSNALGAACPFSKVKDQATLQRPGRAKVRSGVRSSAAAASPGMRPCSRDSSYLGLMASNGNMR